MALVRMSLVVGCHNSTGTFFLGTWLLTHFSDYFSKMKICRHGCVRSKGLLALADCISLMKSVGSPGGRHRWTPDLMYLWAGGFCGSSLELMKCTGSVVGKGNTASWIYASPSGSLVFLDRGWGLTHLSPYLGVVTSVYLRSKFHRNQDMYFLGICLKNYFCSLLLIFFPLPCSIFGDNHRQEFCDCCFNLRT